MEISPIKSLYNLEDIAKKRSIIHDLNPIAKIITTFAYILVVVSFNRYNVVGPLYMFSYLFIIISLAGLPVKHLISRLFFSIPFCLFMGLSGILINNVTAIHIASFGISYGVISFVVIFLRMFLTVSAITVLIGTTPFNKLTKSLLRIHVPRIFILVIEMCYRYLGIVFIEKKAGVSAYYLRSNQKRGIALKDAGSFVGILFIKNIDRAKRIFFAMKLRGYRMERGNVSKEKLNKHDVAYMAVIAVYLIVVRFLGTL